MVAVDTNIIIAQQNKRLTYEQKQLLAQSGDLALPCIVAGELLFGARNSSQAAANLTRYREAIQQFRLLALDALAAEYYAKIRLELKLNGTPIPENDMWIAAICRANDVPLFTLDRHFSYVAGLQLLNG